MKTRIVLILITLLCATMTSVQSARAATITVTNTNDSGAGSLRQALADANDGDTIDFSVTTPATITLTSGQLLVSKSVTISGPGADQLSVDGNAASPVFQINPGKTATISGLTITNGVNGIYNYGTLTINNSTLSGNVNSAYGGIYNADTLTINNSTLSGNSGGIWNEMGTLTINNSTISDNGSGGGIYSRGDATMTVNNSTISGNNFAGIYNQSWGGYAPLTITNSTVSDNVYAGIYNAAEGATLMIGNTILNNNGSWNIYNDYVVTSLGYNLSSDDGLGVLTGPGDQINTDPMLGPLQDNGGPTFTHALSCGSPAINAGDPSFTPPPDYDQRGPGFARVVNGRIDTGAFELQATGYSAPVQPPINADGTSIFTVRRGVVPVRFTLTEGCTGVATCDLPPATIAVTRTAGGVIGQVNESVYSGPSDSGSNFRIEGCQYQYNLYSSGLGAGTYRVDILIDGQVVGSATFQLK